jgi:hypothetical protein
MSNAANGTVESVAAGHAGPAGRIGPDEVLITLTEAAKRLPRLDGKKVSVCTLWRWCRVGLRGVFLEYVRVGRTICTTREAMLRFFSRLADLDEHPSPDKSIKSHPRLPRHFLSRKRSPITSRQRQRALAEADAVLERAGI